MGDSRAIASVRGEVQQLSFDHKPANEGEEKRIIAAGGWVEFNRVNGKSGRNCSLKYCAIITYLCIIVFRARCTNVVGALFYGREVKCYVGK